MILDLKKVFSIAEKQILGAYHFNMSNVKFNNQFPFTSPISVCYFIKNNPCFATLELNISFSLLYLCDRCAEKTEKNYNYVFSHTLTATLENCDNINYILIKDYKINLDSIVYEDILLNLPTRILCSESCKGICPYCGKNLNKSNCNCNENFIDSRFEALKKLLND